MIRGARTFGVLLAVAGAMASRSAAQSSVRDILIVDSLSPAKMQLRDYVAELRDTLTLVESMHARISRANASGMNAVVLSSGRQLGARCQAGATMVETTQQRVSVMKTSDVRGEQALASYRGGLTTLGDKLRICQRDDSTTMAGARPDQQRIQQISAAASTAIQQYDEIRDALLTLLGITLPVRAYHGAAPH